MATTTQTSSASASATPTLDPGNFANGLFSDFAPLLTLFGDEVTRQFLTTSLGLGDNILLGLAPIGIITVIVSAIRVCGDPFLKSIIGRSRDSPIDEEKDLLSSTSNNIREIWDGNRVLRQSGDSQTTEFTFSTHEVALKDWRINALETLESSLRVENGFYDKPSYRIKERSYWRTFRRPSKSAINAKPNLSPPVEEAQPHYNVESELADDLRTKAPNLTLNVPTAIPTETEVWLWASIGIVLQLTVFIFNALAVYYFQWSREGYVVAQYGYPVWASGTLCISIGAYMCASVMQSCTKQSVVEPNLTLKDYELDVAAEGASTDATNAPSPDGDPGFRIVRLQKAIPSLKLPAFAIYNKEENPRVRISRRILLPPGSEFTSQDDETLDTAVKNDQSESRWIANLTWVATFITLIGFILQNVGTRELHWSGGVSQLIATLLMVVIRALARRHVGNRPARCIKLKAGFEASQLSSDIRNFDQYMTFIGRVSREAQHPNARPPRWFLLPIATRSDENSLYLWTRRLTEARRMFLNYQPGLSEVDEMAIKVYESMKAILKLLRIDDFEFDQALLVEGTAIFAGSKSARFEGLMPQSFSSTSSRPEIIASLQDLFSFTFFHHSKSRSDNPLPKQERSTKCLRIAGYCPIDQTDNPSFRRTEEYMLKNVGRMTRWERAPDGRITFAKGPEQLFLDPEEKNFYRLFEMGGGETVLGMPYSANEFLAKGGTAIELLKLSNMTREVIALDFITNFMFQLASRKEKSNDEEKPPREVLADALRSSTFSPMGGNSLFENLTRILIEHGLCETSRYGGDSEWEDGLLTIAAAVFATGLIPPDLKPEVMLGSEPATGSSDLVATSPS